jgi:hypothetical protein
MGDDLFPRHLSAELEAALAAARVVNVIGPRQTGKTTLVRDLFHGGRFVTLDNPGALAALRSDALGQLQALDWMGFGPDFADALHLAKARGCSGFVSFDRKFAKAANLVGDIKVRVP